MTQAIDRVAGVRWNKQTQSALEQLIKKGAGKKLPVVFDCDNTIICGDVGEATLAILARSKVIKQERLPPTLSPPLRIPDRGTITLQSCADLTEYYKAFLAPTVHGGADPNPLANGHVWAVEVLEGLSPLDVIDATREAFQLGLSPKPCWIEVTPGKIGFPAPFFYPEMVDLMAELLRHQFDIWIISASNVWSVRWMVLHALNPLLRQRGVKEGLPANHIIGISTLLADRHHGMLKDRVLVREHAGYAALNTKVLRSLRITSRLEFPVPTYSGKIACMFDAFGHRPYLCAGDTPSDLPMLSLAQNRLWIARLEKPAYQRATAELMRVTGKAGWLIQPTLTTQQSAGFVDSLRTLSGAPGKLPGEVKQSAAILSRLIPNL